MASTTLVLLALLVVALLLGIAIDNRLTRLCNATANAFAQIAVRSVPAVRF